MSDYSFLRTGFSNIKEKPKISDSDREDIEIILGLFTSNALINASKYTELCKRNAVTKTDMLYGLQYEVFEFLQRPDLEEGLQEIRDEYYNMKDEDGSEYSSEDDNDDGGGEENRLPESLDDLVIPDEEISNFERISSNLITEENKEFIDKIHNYNDTWDNWVPQTGLEIILKNAVDKINNNN
jgi:hypothetical protein